MLPHFETERLLLRPRTMADFDACLAMDRDPEVTRFIPGPWSDPEKHEAFLKWRIETDFGKGLGYWSIFPKATPEQFVGWVLLIPRDGVGPEIEIGWRFNRAAWGKGYATEAARPVPDHAFHNLELDQVIAEILAGNQASMHVAEKIGMTFMRNCEHEGQPCKRYVKNNPIAAARSA